MLIPVILSGGAGTRLWPVSREGHPKPFMTLADGQTLIGKTYRRAAALANPGNLITVTNRDYYFLSKDEFEAAKLGDGRSASYLLEPAGRNTAPAVALAAISVAETFGRDAMLLVLAADHLILDEKAFGRAVAQAVTLAEQDWLVTPRSSRVGMRLHGQQPLARSRPQELPSEGTVTGAIQVPADGQPVLFLADHPLTGGYPVIAVVASHHLALAAQTPVGCRLRLRVIAPFAPAA